MGKYNIKSLYDIETIKMSKETYFNIIRSIDIKISNHEIHKRMYNENKLFETNIKLLYRKLETTNLITKDNET